MRHTRPITRLRTLTAAIIAALALGIAAPSCGSIRTYGGIEHDYEYDFDDYHHKHKKHKKHKKHHKRHRHHHDDDDD